MSAHMSGVCKCGRAMLPGARCCWFCQRHGGVQGVCGVCGKLPEYLGTDTRGCVVGFHSCPGKALQPPPESKVQRHAPLVIRRCSECRGHFKQRKDQRTRLVCFNPDCRTKRNKRLGKDARKRFQEKIRKLRQQQKSAHRARMAYSRKCALRNVEEAA